MGVAVSHQAALLWLALGTGIFLGLLYDLIRPLRRRCSPIFAGILDFCFSFVSAVLLFLYSLGAGDGRLGIWELAFALLGFLLYLYSVSDFFYSCFSRAFVFVLRRFACASAYLSKYAKSANFFFKKMVKCYIIKDRT